MKIIDDSPLLTYQELYVGDIFEYALNYYMVTDARNPKNNRHNAIKLSTGVHCNFSGDEVVKLCEATLHIKKICGGE